MARQGTSGPDNGSGTQDYYCLIRFDSSYAYNYWNTIKKQSNMINRNYCGMELAFIPQLNNFEGGGGRRSGIGLLYFPDLNLAQLWLTSSSEVRQQDWLHSTDITLIPTRAEFRFNMPIVEVIQWQYFRDVHAFQKDYLSTIPSDVGQGRHNVAAAPEYACKRLRGNGSGQYVVINQWPSVEAVKKYSSDNSVQIKQFLENVAVGTIQIGVNEC